MEAGNQDSPARTYRETEEKAQSILSGCGQLGAGAEVGKAGRKGTLGGRHFNLYEVQRDLEQTRARFYRLECIVQQARRPMSEIPAEEFIVMLQYLRELGYTV